MSVKQNSLRLLRRSGVMTHKRDDRNKPAWIPFIGFDIADYQYQLYCRVNELSPDEKSSVEKFRQRF